MKKLQLGQKPDLSVEFAGIRLKNPVLTASGTFGYGEEFSDFVDLNRLGGVIVKGISLKPILRTPAWTCSSPRNFPISGSTIPP
jgi:dihydroorotate dehydrogenase